MSVDDVILAIKSCTDDTFKLSKVKITHDPSTLKNKTFYNVKEGAYIFQSGKTIILDSCEISNFNLYRSHFKTLIISNAKAFSRLGIDYCDFEGDLVINTLNTSFTASIDNCLFKGDVSLFFSQPDNTLYLNNSTFSSSCYLGGNYEYVRIRECKFEYANDTKVPGQLYGIGWGYQFNAAFGQIESLIMNDCIFSNKSIWPNIYSIDLQRSTISRAHFENNLFEKINLEEVSIEKSLRMDKNKFQDFVFVDNLLLNGENTNLPFENLQGGKIALHNDFDLGNASNDIAIIPYTGTNATQLKDLLRYNDLVSSYNKFLSMYKTRGDRESANACYIELKDLETRRLRFLYKQSKTFKTYINWKLNVFLKSFCDYGTNPVKSIIIALWTILGFGVIYFFFYSEWDKINRSYLIAQHKKIIHYFKHESNLEDIYNETYALEFKSFEEYKQMLNESKIEVPMFIVRLGYPLYYLSKIRHIISLWIFRRTEMLNGKWSELKPVRKFFTGSVISITVVLYILYLVGLRFFNSVILSLNAFSTLGFGDIPVRGISRYVAIIEGFTGWFLLSIFSVTLINQILQS